MSCKSAAPQAMHKPTSSDARRVWSPRPVVGRRGTDASASPNRLSDRCWHAASVDDADLARAIDRACRLTGQFTLRSGQVSAEYFDKYRFESDPRLLRALAERMVPSVPEETELLGGLELGGVPIVTVLSALTGIPAVFIRKEAKTYGTCRLAEGADVRGRQVTLVEDVLTTGGAVRDAATALRAMGAAVDVVLCAIDRRGQDRGPLTDIDLETRAVLTKADLDAVHSEPGL